MKVMFRDFDDGGWWLGIKQYRGVGDNRSWPKNS